MRRTVLAVSSAAVLAGPAVTALFDGGYFAQARLLAGAIAWLLLAALLLVGGSPLPRGGAGRLAGAGLLLLTGWTALSALWAPLTGPVVADLQRLLLYVAVLALAIAALRAGRTAKHVEPVLAAGAFLVIAYGMSERLVPGLIELEQAASAGGRLHQPLGYWSAEGAIAGIGLVLCAHVAGDRTRSSVARRVAAAAAPLLGAGLYLTFSRGAVAATVIGVAVLLALAPSWAQLRATGVLLGGCVLAAAGAAVLPAVSSLSGAAGGRQAQGAGMAAILAGAAILSVVGQAWSEARERREGPRQAELPRGRRLVMVGLAASLLLAVGLVATGNDEPRAPRGPEPSTTSSKRLLTVSSNRYAYWRVALDGFANRPLQGRGAGNFRVLWLQERKIRESVRDAHSLELETAAELGMPGLIALAMLLGGVAAAGRRSHRRRPELVAGWCAALAVWTAHSALDWDWEMPGVTLIAIVLAGGLITEAEGPASRPGRAG